MNAAPPSSETPRQPVSTVRKLIPWILVLLVIAAGGWLIWANQDELAELEFGSPIHVAVVALALAATVACMGELHRAVLKVFGVHLTILEAFSLSAITIFSNFALPMRSGNAIQAVYLKRTHHLPFALFASSMAALSILFLGVSCGLGLAAMLWISFETQTQHPLLAAFLALACVGSIGLVFVPPPSGLKQDNRILRAMARIASGWDQIRRSRETLRKATFILIANTLASAIGIYSGFHTLSLPLSPEGSVLLATSQLLGGIMNITPGALGFREAFGIFFATALDITPTKTLIALAAIRVIKILTAVALALPASAILKRQSRRS